MEKYNDKVTLIDEDKKKGMVTRSLMTNDEIRTMKINKALLVCGHHPPIIARLKPFYKNKAYLQYSQLESPDMNAEQLAYVVPLLLLKSTKKHHEENQEA